MSDDTPKPRVEFVYGTPPPCGGSGLVPQMVLDPITGRLRQPTPFEYKLQQRGVIQIIFHDETPVEAEPLGSPSPALDQTRAGQGTVLPTNADELQFLRAAGFVEERKRKSQEHSAHFWRRQGYEVDAAGVPLPKDTIAWPSPKPEAAASGHEPQEDDQCPMI